MSEWELLVMVIQSLMKHYELKDIIQAIKEEIDKDGKGLHEA